MKDIRIGSWGELLHMLNPSDKTSFERYRSSFVYRGVADASWKLDTSLQRSVLDPINLEKPLLRSFKKYIEPGTLSSDSIWMQLTLAQHHGLPTRLLDWTVAPQVALHFATAEEEYYDKDAAIWCIDIVEARKQLPRTFQTTLKNEYAYLFSVEMLESVKIKTLGTFDALKPFLLFFEPPSLDGRIVNQWGIMSVMNGAAIKLHEYLENHPDLYQRYIIPKELKWEIRDRLDQNNVTERMLFPGLDGLCKWLKRYYGPGPQKQKKPSPASCNE